MREVLSYAAESLRIALVQAASSLDPAANRETLSALATEHGPGSDLLVLHAGVPPMPESIPYSVQQIVRRALEKARNLRPLGDVVTIV